MAILKDDVAIYTICQQIGQYTLIHWCWGATITPLWRTKIFINGAETATSGRSRNHGDGATTSTQKVTADQSLDFFGSNILTTNVLHLTKKVGWLWDELRVLNKNTPWDVTYAIVARSKRAPWLLHRMKYEIRYP